MIYGLTMKPETKKAWINGLLSENYEQATGALHREDESGQGFCCLGVFSEVQNIPSKPVGNFYLFKFSGKESYSAPSLDWFEQFFDFQNNPEVITKEHALQKLIEKLIQMNDTNGCTFNDIAGWIRVNL